MKISKSKLRQIIKEERVKLLSEMSNDAHEDWRREEREEEARQAMASQEHIKIVARDLKHMIALSQHEDKDSIPFEVLEKFEQLLRLLGVAE